MATTNGKKPQAKPKSTKSARKATAEASQPAVRKTAAAKPVPVAPPPEPAPKAPMPDPAPKVPAVLLNAVKPDEKLADTAFVERAVSSFEKSLKAAVPAAVAVNSKLVDIAQANMNAGMELARDLAGAKTPMEMMRLGMTYWHENMGVFRAQAEELRTLSAVFVTRASEPIRDHIRRA